MDADDPAALPAWAQGLVEGTPTAAFRGSAAPAGHLDLLRFVPLEGPPVVVDVAAYTIATSREGRALMRAHYEVRNERAASLRVRPPPGFEVLGVRVGGATATPARDRDGAWRIPLQRSVETVSGLLSFPVELALLGGDDDAWRRRERRPRALPVLDAPVAVAGVTLHLPPGHRSRLDPGDGDVVAGFTRGDGITYGLGVGAVVFLGGVYGLLGVHFIAAFQVLIYVGAVMVFMVYAIMLLDPRDESAGEKYSKLLWPGIIGFALLAEALAVGYWNDLPHAPRGAAGEPFDLARFSQAFLSEYWLHFELTSVLLLAAVVAALAVIKENRRHDHG